MRFREIEQRADGNDASRINLAVCDVVVPFNVIEIDRVSDAGLLIQVHKVSLQIGIIDTALEIALEVAVINRIKTHQRAE